MFFNYTSWTVELILMSQTDIMRFLFEAKHHTYFNSVPYTIYTNNIHFLIIADDIRLTRWKIPLLSIYYALSTGNYSMIPGLENNIFYFKHHVEGDVTVVSTSLGTQN